MSNTLISEQTRLALAEDYELGCGNFLRYAVRTNPAPFESFVTCDRPIRSLNGPRGTSLSLADIETLAQEYAAWYHTKGVRAKDPVAVFIAEGVENLIHFVALTSIGAIPALINGGMKPEIAAAFAKKVGVVAVVSDKARITEIAKNLDISAYKFVSTDEDSLAETHLPSLYPFHHVADDAVLVGHSSGTTGIPKAVVFHHQQFFHGIRYRLGLPRNGGSERILSALPHSHSAGIAYVMLAVLSGTPLRVLSDNSPDIVLPHIEAFEPTMVVAFPETFVEMCEKDFNDYNLSSVRLWVNGGDAAHEAHIRKLVSVGTWQKGKGSLFIDGLGSSEMGFSLFRMVHTPETTVYNRCIGSALDWVDAVILDDDGNPLPPNRVGRLGVQAPSITPGYWNDSVMTHRARVQGYWLTGDLFYKDEGGRFYHVDRIPDAIRTSYGMVYSLQYEEFLMKECPELSDCTIIGAPLDDNFMAALVLIRLKPGKHEPQEDLTEKFNAVLTRAGKLPVRRVLVVSPESIPLGPTGKVLKRELRDKYRNAFFNLAAIQS
jgi:acyl-coenzyme A synthetase/AMP-(fatty) acid ligase